MLKGQLPNGFWPFFLCKYTKYIDTIDFFARTGGFMVAFQNDVLMRNPPCPIIYIDTIVVIGPRLDLIIE